MVPWSWFPTREALVTSQSPSGFWVPTDSVALPAGQVVNNDRPPSPRSWERKHTLRDTSLTQIIDYSGKRPIFWSGSFSVNSDLHRNPQVRLTLAP